MKDSIERAREIIDALDEIPSIVLEQFPHIYEGFLEEMKALETQEVVPEKGKMQGMGRMCISKQQIINFINHVDQTTVAELNDHFGSKNMQSRITKLTKGGYLKRKKDLTHHNRQLYRINKDARIGL